MSRIFTIVGDQKESGTWREPRPMFTGRLVIDDDGIVLGYAAFGKKFARGVYGVSLPQKNGDYAIAFALMSNRASEAQALLFRCENIRARSHDLSFVEGKNTPNGIWATIDEPTDDESTDEKSTGSKSPKNKSADDKLSPKITTGESRVKLSEEPFSEKAAFETRRIAHQTDLSIGENDWLFNNYELFKGWLLQVPGVLPPEEETERTA